MPPVRVLVVADRRLAADAGGQDIVVEGTRDPLLVPYLLLTQAIEVVVTTKDLPAIVGPLSVPVLSLDRLPDDAYSIREMLERMVPSVRQTDAGVYAQSSLTGVVAKQHAIIDSLQAMIRQAERGLHEILPDYAAALSTTAAQLQAFGEHTHAELTLKPTEESYVQEDFATPVPLGALPPEDAAGQAAPPEPPPSVEELASAGDSIQASDALSLDSPVAEVAAADEETLPFGSASLAEEEVPPTSGDAGFAEDHDLSLGPVAREAVVAAGDASEDGSGDLSPAHPSAVTDEVTPIIAAVAADPAEPKAETISLSAQVEPEQVSSPTPPPQPPARGRRIVVSISPVERLPDVEELVEALEFAPGLTTRFRVFRQGAYRLDGYVEDAERLLAWIRSLPGVASARVDRDVVHVQPRSRR